MPDTFPLTVPAALATLIRDCPQRDALVTIDDRMSWQELDEASRRLAAVFVQLGVSRRTRVGLLMGNGIEWAVSAFALLRIGAVLVPLSTLLRAPELEQQLHAAAVQRLLLAFPTASAAVTTSPSSRTYSLQRTCRRPACLPCVRCGVGTKSTRCNPPRATWKLAPLRWSSEHVLPMTWRSCSPLAVVAARRVSSTPMATRCAQ